MKRFLWAVLTPLLSVLVLCALVLAGHFFGFFGVVMVAAVPVLAYWAQGQWRQATNNRYVDPSLPPVEMAQPSVPRPRPAAPPPTHRARQRPLRAGPALAWLVRLEYLLAVLWVLWFTPVVYNGLFSDYHASRGIGMQRLFAQLGSVGIAALLAITFLSVQHGYFGLRLRARWLGWLGGCGALALLLWLRRSG